jgi:hypothetical protein
MNAKELKIEAPEGYEVDWDNSSKTTIRFKPSKKKVTYVDICNELFFNKSSWRLLETGVTKFTKISDSAIIYSRLTAPSDKQLEQLVALNKLMNVAKYLNGDWKINWKSTQEKYYIVYDYWKYVLTVTCTNSFQSTLVYFESPSLAKQAIEILGEEEIKKALGIFE